MVASSGGWRRARVLAAGLLAGACALGMAPGAFAQTEHTAQAGPAGGTSWTVYHGSAEGTGVAASVTTVDTRTRAWTSPTLDGQIYGEPLVWAGRVYVATENDTVYALSSATGAVAWSEHLGTPVPAGSLPCGDISPTVGITGTPVIDPSRGEILVVADELVHGVPAHMLTGLSAASGATELTEDVDPPGADPAALLQRTGLTLDDGQVLFGMGGNFGDCSSYRGRVGAVPEAGGTPRYFTVDSGPGESQGAIWMGGAAPVVDPSGNIWVATGNGSVYSSSHAYDDGDGVLELSPSLALLQYFAPANWAANNSQDLDMSTAPALLPDGQVILTGKSRIVYLLDGAHLGGIGGQQATLGSACPEDIDGGVAMSGMTVYCPAGPASSRFRHHGPRLHCTCRGVPERGAVHPSSRPAGSGLSDRTVSCTGSVPLPARCHNGRRSARWPITSRPRLWPTACCWPRQPPTSSRSPHPARPPPPPPHPRRRHRYPMRRASPGAAACRPGPSRSSSWPDWS